MNIASINNFSLNKTKAQNFNGLWGKTTVKADIDNVLYIPKIVEIRYYYPYADETPQMIQDVLAKKQDAKIITEGGNSRYIIHDCKLGKTLPFNEQQFEAYYNLPSTYKGSKVISDIHSLVKNKYINDETGSRQIPAVNPNIDERHMDSYV